MEDFFTKVPDPFLKFRLPLTKRKVQESLFEEKGVKKRNPISDLVMFRPQPFY